MALPHPDQTFIRSFSQDLTSTFLRRQERSRELDEACMLLDHVCSSGTSIELFALTIMASVRFVCVKGSLAAASAENGHADWLYVLRGRSDVSDVCVRHPMKNCPSLWREFVC